MIDEKDKKDIPIDIVPDDQMQSALGQSLGGVDTLLQALNANNIDRPSYTSVPVGTPTMAREGFDEGIRQYDQSFAEGQRQFDQSFAEGQRQFDSSMAARLAGGGSRSSSGGVGGGSIKPPTEKEKLMAIQAGAINYMKDLMTNLPTGMGVIKPPSPELAVKDTIRMIQSQLGELQLTSSEYNNLVKMLYNAAGVDPSSGKENSNDILSLLGGL